RTQASASACCTAPSPTTSCCVTNRPGTTCAACRTRACRGCRSAWRSISRRRDWSATTRASPASRSTPGTSRPTVARTCWPASRTSSACPASIPWSPASVHWWTTSRASVMRTLSACAEQWPLAREFRISRATKTAASVVVVELGEDGIAGRGECLPYPRYGETPESVIAAIEAMRGALAGGLDRVQLQEAMGPGAARNAIDAALIDLECKASGRRAWDVLGIDAPGPVVTAYTIGMDEPAAMAREAGKHRARRLLKLKLGARNAVDCVRAV